MDLPKKLLFGIFFLISLTGFHYLFSPLFNSYDWVFGFGTDTLRLVFGAAGLLLLSGIFFIVFASLSQDFKIGTPIALLGAAIPLFFSQTMLAVVLSGGFAVAFILFYLQIQKAMASYITFSPTQLLSHSAKTLTTVMVLVVSLGFYLSINQIIKKDGFKIPETILPDALIEQVIKSQTGSVLGAKYIAQGPQLTPQQIQLLRQNPELLRQYGVDPALLDQYEASQKPTTSTASGTPSSPTRATEVPTMTTTTPAVPTSMVKNLVFDQINSIAKQYEYIVAPLLALMVWSLFAFANFFLFLLVNPLLWILFNILESTGFIRFEKEMREVKKLVV